MTNKELVQMDTLDMLKLLRSQIDMAIGICESGWLKVSGPPDYRNIEDGKLGVIGDFEIRARFVEPKN